MKKLTALFLVLCFIGLSAKAADFDTSVDSQIRKDYIDSDTLPPLPSATPGSSGYKGTVTSNVKETGTVYNPTGKTYTLKHGTKIKLASRSVIADTLPVGSKISFSSKNDIVTKEGMKIPAGTVFRGTVTDSHRPQISSNGGLVELNINEIYFNGILSGIETKLSDANYKKVMRNDIKGKHSYWTNFEKSLKPGRKFFNAANNVANIFTPVPVIQVVAIVPWALGVTVYAVNLVASPFIALFSKGGSLTLPAGTELNIKIKNNSIIKG